MPSKEKFYVRVCRPRFEVAAIEVSASDHDEAKLTAAWMATELPDRAWTLLPFDHTSYFPHVEECISDHDMGANADAEDPKEAQIEEMMTLQRERYEQYLLLLGDVGSGEGRVVFQPWCCSHDPGLLEIDLSGDWTYELDAVFNNRVSGNEPWLDLKHASIADNDE